MARKVYPTAPTKPLPELRHSGRGSFGDLELLKDEVGQASGRRPLKDARNPNDEKGWNARAWQWAAGFVGGFTAAGAAATGLAAVGAPTAVATVLSAAAVSVVPPQFTTSGSSAEAVGQGAAFGAGAYALTSAIYSAGSAIEAGFAEVEDALEGIGDIVDVGSAIVETYQEAEAAAAFGIFNPDFWGAAVPGGLPVYPTPNPFGSAPDALFPVRP